jgi:hypothetical protein
MVANSIKYYNNPDSSNVEIFHNRDIKILETQLE